MVLWLVSWFVGVNLQGSVFRGNSDLTVLTGRLEGGHHAGHTRISGFVKAGYGLQDTTVTANTLEAGLQMDLPLSPRVEFFLLTTYFADPVARVSYRSDGGMGVKYRFLETPDREISLSAAPLYAVEKFAGQPPSRDIRLSIRPKLEWKTATGVGLRFLLFYKPAFSDWSDVQILATFQLEAPLGTGLSFLLEVEDRYTSVVPAGVKPNDLRISAGANWRMVRN